MGATLRYAKVVDRDHLQEHGGLSPGTDNLVLLRDREPGIARDFLVLRAWDDADGAFDETWRLEDPYGQVVYTGTPRTVLADDGDLYDELQGVRFDYGDSGFQLVLEVDGREVARTDFTVAVAGDGSTTAPESAGADVTSSERSDRG
ncbi:MAG TPA: hypothetical protein VK891_11990 [Euzebyales bacterium]|nr:hypothetical protein [Euzebyales bacterium]